jgi:hypothetical protein
MVAAVQSSTFLFLEAFSNLVTTDSSRESDWLARSGVYSIHSLLSDIVPEVRNVRYQNISPLWNMIIMLLQSLRVSGDSMIERCARLSGLFFG